MIESFVYIQSVFNVSTRIPMLFTFTLTGWLSDLWQPCLTSLSGLLSLFTDLALDPRGSSCFGWRNQRLTLLNGSIMMKYFVNHFGSLVKLFGLALQQKIVQSPKQNIFIRKLSHLTISSPFILINQKMHKNHSSFWIDFCCYSLSSYAPGCRHFCFLVHGFF